MTLVSSFPFSQRCSRLAELVETSGEFDRWRTVMENKPTLGWEATGEWNLQTKLFKTWWVHDGESKTTDTQDSDAFPSGHWRMGERAPHARPPPGRRLQPFPSTPKALQNLDCSSLAVPRQNSRATSHRLSPGMRPTCVPATPRDSSPQNKLLGKNILAQQHYTKTATIKRSSENNSYRITES